MKLSVSLSDGDVAFLDSYAKTHGFRSRSGVVQEALALPRARQLGVDYEAAWGEWTAEARLWDTTLADGLDTR